MENKPQRVQNLYTMPTVDTKNILPHLLYAQRVRANALFLEEPPEDTPPPSAPNCCTDCTTISVLADENDTDNLRNDKYTIVYKKIVETDTFTFTLEKLNGTWSDLTVLLDTVHGAGFSYTDGDFIEGFTIDWRSILILFGEGNYRVRAEGTGLTAYTHYSFVFCLSKYTDNKADGTIRFDWTLNGKQPDVNHWRLKADYGKNDIPMQMRLVGMFGFLTVEYENQEDKYTTGLSKRYRTQTTPNYTFKSGRYWWQIHNLLMFNAIPNDSLSVTDYNVLNKHGDIREIPVLSTSGYAPDYNKGQSLLSRVTVEFTDRKWDFDRRNC